LSLSLSPCLCGMPVPADIVWDVVSATRRSSGVGVALRTCCARVYARVCAGAAEYLHTYIRSGCSHCRLFPLSLSFCLILTDTSLCLVSVLFCPPSVGWLDCGCFLSCLCSMVQHGRLLLVRVGFDPSPRYIVYRMALGVLTSSSLSLSFLSSSFRPCYLPPTPSPLRLRHLSLLPPLLLRLSVSLVLRCALILIFQVCICRFFIPISPSVSCLTSNPG